MISNIGIFSNNSINTLAEAKFQDKSNLNEAIKEKILPLLITVQGPDCSSGSGFFRYQNWLTSNAHVFPNYSFLKSSSLINYKGESCHIHLDSSYHRPSENEFAPDLTIAKVSQSTLPTALQEFNEDPKYHENHLFYIDYDFSEAQGTFDVKHLKQVSSDDTYPVIYECKDGTSPQHGNSGSPIIKASIITSGSEPVWYFEIMGVLYGRCDTNWCSENYKIPLEDLENKKLVCSIPCSEDFKQILDALIAHDEVQYLKARISEQKQTGKNDELIEVSIAQDSKSLAEEQTKKETILKSYADGMSPLDIQLPHGLEKLKRYSWTKAKEMCSRINEFLEELSSNKRLAEIPENLIYDCGDDHQYQHFNDCYHDKSQINRAYFKSNNSDNFKAFLNSNAFLLSIFKEKYFKDPSILSDSLWGGLERRSYGIDFSAYRLELGSSAQHYIMQFRGTFGSCHLWPVADDDVAKLQSMTTICARKLIENIRNYEIQHPIRSYPLSYSR